MAAYLTARADGDLDVVQDAVTLEGVQARDLVWEASKAFGDGVQFGLGGVLHKGGGEARRAS